MFFILALVALARLCFFEEQHFKPTVIILKQCQITRATSPSSSLTFGNQSQQLGNVALGLLQVALQSLGLLELVVLLEVPFLDLLLQLEKLNADSFFHSFLVFLEGVHSHTEFDYIAVLIICF